MSETEEIEAGSGGPPRKRRRRRRRRKSREPSTDALLVEEGGGGPTETTIHARGGSRRQTFDISGPAISVPSSGRNPHKKRNSRPRRSSPRSASARKRKLSRTQLDELGEWLKRMPEALIANLYRGLGGQPNRVSGADRMIQLTLRAISHGGRMDGLMKSFHERDRKAIAAILQCGGIAHSGEFIRELMDSFGGHEREWTKTMSVLAEKGIVFSTGATEREFFYVVPSPLIDGLVDALDEEMRLPEFDSEDVELVDSKPFCPPLDFSITSLATYIDHHHPRLTQRQEIYRHDKEEMDVFFSQLWSTDSELFAFHLDFLMMHGMVELRGEFLALNRDVMEEWLMLEPEDQRDLIFRALDRRFSMAEWVLWAIHAADGAWVPERPLAALYRRWKRGEDWRDRHARGQTQASRSSDRSSYSFAPLVRSGVLELGQWGQEKFYRLSPRGKVLLSPPEDDGFRQFYLTPSFEAMAPAGLAPVLLFRLGELAELTGCDRANTYKITDISIERAIERGWRRDDVLQFLRDNSQIGLPENVEQTLKGWIGHRGDVEFHDLMLLTIHRSQIRRFEGNKRMKPYILHRFGPGMYAVDRHRRDEIARVLKDSKFDPSNEVRGYPGDPSQVEARQKLRRLLTEAREDSLGPSNKSGVVNIEPEDLRAVPGSRLASKAKAKAKSLPSVTAAEARTILERAMVDGVDVKMVYRTRTGQASEVTVQPQRLAFKGTDPVLVGLDREEDARRTFMLERIERLAPAEEA